MNRVRKLADRDAPMEVVGQVPDRLDDASIETPASRVLDIQPQERRLERVQRKPMGLRQAGDSKPVGAAEAVLDPLP